MKPRPGVPFSWYYGGDFGTKEETLILRKRRLSRNFHNTEYYLHANEVWARVGKWGQRRMIQLGGWRTIKVRRILVNNFWEMT